jgi:hypothetical protein
MVMASPLASPAPPSLCGRPPPLLAPLLAPPPLVIGSSFRSSLFSPGSSPWSQPDDRAFLGAFSRGISAGRRSCMNRRGFLKSLIAVSTIGFGAASAASPAFAQDAKNSAKALAEALPETMPAQAAQASQKLDTAAGQGEWAHWYYHRRRRWRRRRVVYYYHRPRHGYWRRRHWRRRYYHYHW